MSRILVIGVTGNVGREVCSQLASAGAKVRAMTRNPHTANFLEGIEVVFGDLTAPATLLPCLRDVDALFLVWTAPPAAVAPALHQIANFAPRLVFLSAPLKTPHPFFQQSNPARTLTAQIERCIEDSGLAWTFLRPTIFALNSIYWWGPQIRAGDAVRWPYLEVPTAPIHERDIAAVAVRALCEIGHSGKEYVITGPESLTQAEQILTISRVVGRSSRTEEISPEQARIELRASMPAVVVDMLLAAWAAAAGQPAFVTSTVAEITGKPARTFFDWAKDHTADFRV